jgi:hypothetical protein
VIAKRSIRELYPLAFSEGEGVGTAYEYYAKRLLLADWLAAPRAPFRVLVAGLPQKYGCSLDFLLLAHESGGQITVIDDRPLALQRLQGSLERLCGLDAGLRFSPQLILTASLSSMVELQPAFDLVLSSEVLQRLPEVERPAYVSRLVSLAHEVALFTPNGDNDAHVGHSGLSSLRLEELEEAAAAGLSAGRETAVVTSLRTGYVDMPPFPPGITRSETERAHAASGRLEAAAMAALGAFARVEHIVPRALRKTHSHIVYAFIRLSQR